MYPSPHITSDQFYIYIVLTEKEHQELFALLTEGNWLPASLKQVSFVSQAKSEKKVLKL